MRRCGIALAVVPSTGSLNPPLPEREVHHDWPFERGAKAAEIDVDTHGGTVTLQGEVGTHAERRLAVKVAEDVGGVTEVVDRIRVRDSLL